MCGLAVIHHYASAAEVDRETLLDMRATLAHRGPDGAGIWLSGDRSVGLAQTRLSIIDIEHGQQPMIGPGGVALVCNGEIYNYPELRRELERDGASFATDCDVEVILHLYVRHGAALVDHLDGMFAFVVWDPARQTLLAARDRIGEKPLYFADAGGKLLLASEIKALLEHPEVTPEVDAAAVDAYFTHLAVPAPATLFRGISKLPPGGLLVADETGPRLRRYWSAASTRRWRGDSLEEAVPELRGMLEHSVTSRLMSDVPVGALLSGGLDSTAIVALAAQAGKTLRTFSVGFERGGGEDERPKARRVAEHFGAEHHEVEVSEEDAMGFLPDLIHYQDEPLADPVCIPLSFVCGLARETDTPVVLAGEGADELFWGYPTYMRHWAWWPMIRASLALPSLPRSAFGRVSAAVEHPYLHELLDGVGRGRLAPMHVPTGLSHRLRRQLLRGEANWLGGWAPTDDEAERERRSDRETLAFDTQDHEFEVRLPELLLMRIDRFSMRHGVEARVPFLAPKLVEYAYSLDPALKLVDGTSKLVMREALRGVVPDWTLEQPKRGFGAPTSEWLSRSFGPLLDGLLAPGPLDAYLDTQSLRARLLPHRQGRRRRPWQRDPYWLWPVLNFALWHHHWIEGRSIESLVDRVRTAREPALEGVG